MSRTLRKLINHEVLGAVGFVTLGFVALFLFFDLVDELQNIGKGGNKYMLRHALGFALLQVPNHVYELLPITVLIGTVFVMARLAQSSEFTILRTSGLGPWRALKQLLGLGLLFAALTLVIGDYLAPAADKRAQLIKAKYQGVITTGLTGAWLRETTEAGNSTVNVANLGGDQQLGGVRVFEFDADGKILAVTRAIEARIDDEGVWQLKNVQAARLTASGALPGQMSRVYAPSGTWRSNINADMLAAALLKPDRMRTLELYSYMQHLKANGQASQNFEIAFWRKLYYPIGCIVMVILALPFAYLHFRSGGITGYVFMGVLIGISFFLLNNMFGYIGNINAWKPWLAASIPSALYLAISLSGFAWLVFRR